MELIADDFQCTICFDIYDDPVIDECGHTFCKECILEWYKSATICPISKIYLQTKKLVPNLLAKVLLKGLGIKCVNHIHGCSWQGRLTHYEKRHRQNCLFANFPENTLKVMASYFEDEVTYIERKQFSDGNLLTIKKPNDTSSIGVIKYNNSDIYEGFLIEQQREGLGRFYDNIKKEIIEGNWSDNQKEGYCVTLKNLEVVSEGNYKNDLKEGLFYIMSELFQIKVTYVNDESIGEARIKYKNGLKYIGEIKNSSPMGKGILYSKNGMIVEGIFEGLKTIGNTIVKLKNGNVYEGETEETQITGKGKMKYIDGSLYEGQFLNGKKNGFGVLKQNVKEDTEIEGNFLNDVLNGEAVHKVSDGSKIYLIYTNGAKSEQGRRVYPNNSIYEGLLNQKLNPSGKGKMTLFDGSLLEGTFGPEGMYGIGTLTKPAGDVFSSKNWAKNKIEGEGEIKFANGDYFKGQFKNILQDGEGCLTIGQALKYTGKWINGFLHGKVKLTNLKTKIDSEVLFDKGVIKGINQNKPKSGLMQDKSEANGPGLIKNSSLMMEQKDFKQKNKLEKDNFVMKKPPVSAKNNKK